ncbi:MAG: hypothetical protein DRJ65_10515, partial [Acidobacteria bacterium]
MYRWHRRERGFTLAELVMVAAL